MDELLEGDLESLNELATERLVGEWGFVLQDIGYKIIGHDPQTTDTIYIEVTTYIYDYDFEERFGPEPPDGSHSDFWI